MAGKRIKGITIEIDGSTTGLDKALKSVDSSLQSTEASLKDVNRLLKLDPQNTELLQQKQKLLANAVDDTSKRLETLKKASEDTAKSADRYDSWKAAFGPIQEEIDQTKERAKKLREQMASMKEIGEIDTDAYKSLQAELKETNGKLKDLQQQAKKVSDEFGNPINPAQYDALQREIVETEQKLNSLESESEATNSALKNGFRDAAHGADTLKDSVDEIGETVKSGVFMEAAEQLSKIGDKLSDLRDGAVETFNDINGASTKASAYFGETGKAAEDTATVIKNVYENGVGDSMDSVSDAVIAVKKNLNDLDQVTLENLTQQAIMLDEKYGIDMNETLRGVNSLMENFGMTAQEAMDYVVAGTQNGLDKTNELGDNLAEYSGKFSQAGYSAQEYFQLLNNGLDGGAYNLDKVNDAINEVTTRLADGTIGENIGMYSDKTQELFKEWQKGGATQKEVIDSIVADISDTTNQQDALNKAAQAFGTMAEDGNLNFITSLTSVGNAYDDVSGKAQGMLDATATPAQEMEANMRKLKDSIAPLGELLSELAGTYIPPLTEAISAIVQGFMDLPAPAQILITSISGIIAAIAKISPVLAALKALNIGSALSGIGTSITGSVLPALASGGAAFGSLIVSMLPIIAAVAAVIAVGVLLYKNWDTIKEKAAELWNNLKVTFENIKNGISEKFQAAKQTVSDIFTGIRDTISNIFIGIHDTISNVCETIKNGISEKFGAVKQTVSDIFTGVGDAVSNAWETIKNVVQVGIMLIAEILNAAFQIITIPFRFIWENCKEYLIAAWETIKTAVLAALEAIQNIFFTIWNAVSTFLTSILNTIQLSFSIAWEAVKTAVLVAMETVRNTFVAVWDEIVAFLTPVLDTIKLAFSNAWEAVKTAVSIALDAIQNTISVVWNAIVAFLTPALDAIKLSFSIAWEAIKNTVSAVLNAIKDTVTSVWNTIKTVLTTILNNIKSTVNTIWNGIKSVISSVTNAIQSVVSSVFNTIKSIISSIMNGIKSTISSIWNGISSAISGAVNTVKSTISSGFNAAKGTVSDVFNAIKTTISDKINGAKDTVKSAIDKIKGFFNFSWSLPKLKLPHPKITGEFSLNPPSVPHFSIDWYKKAYNKAMVLDGPTLFGYSDKTGKLLGGGEGNGNEVVSGEDHLIDLIGSIVSAQNTQLTARLDQLTRILQMGFPQIIDKMDRDVVLEDGTLVGYMASSIDQRLGSIEVQKGRHT